MRISWRRRVGSLALLSGVALVIGIAAHVPGSGSAVAQSLGPATSWHFSPNANWNGSTYVPGSDGFNLADVSSSSQLASLPSGTKAFVWVGMCNGADSTFTSAVQPYAGDSRVFGFYLMDVPQPSTCPAANLKAESDWIHANVPGSITFIILPNQSAWSTPNYQNTYNPSNSGIDNYGIDPYPCRTENNGCNDSWISLAVQAAESSGVPRSAIVPVYQAFGGGNWVDDAGGKYVLPTQAQETQLLSDWAQVVPSPAFDYAYSWGSQNADTALGQSSELQAVFYSHNTGAPLNTPTPTPTPAPPTVPTYVQSTYASGNATLVTMSLSNVIAGDLLVGYFMQYQASGSVQVSDNLNGAWTRVLGQKFDGNSGDEALFYVANAKAGNTTVSVSAASGTYLQATAAEYAGVTASSPLDQAQQSYGSGAAMTTPSTAAVPAGELVYSAVVTGTSFGSATPGSTGGVAFQMRAQTSDIAAEDVLASSAGAQQGAMTFSQPADWNAVVATFKPAKGSGTPTPTPTPTVTPTPTPHPMAFVQTVMNRAAGRSLTLTLAPVHAGDMLIGYFMQYGATGQVSVSDNINGVWTRVIGQHYAGTTHGDVALYFLLNAKPGATTVTVSAAASTTLQATASEYSGVAATKPLDQAAQGYGTGSAVNAKTVGATPAGELVFAAVQTGTSLRGAAAGTTDGIAFVVRGQTLYSATEDVLSSAAGGQQSSFRLSRSTTWNTVVATFHGG